MSIKDEWNDYADECLKAVTDPKQRHEMRKVFYAAFMVGLHTGGDIMMRCSAFGAKAEFQCYVNEMDAYVADINAGGSGD